MCKETLALLFRIRKGKTQSQTCDYSRFSSRKKGKLSHKCDHSNPAEYPSVGKKSKFWCWRMSWQGIWQDRITCQQPHSVHNQSFFPHKTKKKLCHISDKAAAQQPHKRKFRRDWLFLSSFTPKTAMETHQFKRDKFLTSRCTWKLGPW